MLTKFKKSFTIALAAVMCVSSVCASAATWRFKGYDNRVDVKNGQLIVPKVFEEFDDAGYYTGRFAKGDYVVGTTGTYDDEGNPKLFTVGKTIDIVGRTGYAYAELKNPWVDIVYPNVEYAGVYAEGTFIGVNYETGRAGTIDKLVEYKDVDYMWELVAPYGIYSVTKAKLNIGGVAKWFGTPEYNYPTQYTGRNADVRIQRPAYGFGIYEITGANQVTTAKEKVKNFLNPAAAEYQGLSITDLDPKFAKPAISFIAYSDIKIPRTYDYALVGPEFDEVGNATPFAKTVVASKYEGDLNNFGLTTLISTVKDRNGDTQMCEITWADGGYEAIAPYRVYKWLTVDGVVMDGSYIGQINGKDAWKPAIAVYTGAVASNIH